MPERVIYLPTEPLAHSAPFLEPAHGIKEIELANFSDSKRYCLADTEAGIGMPVQSSEDLVGSIGLAAMQNGILINFSELLDIAQHTCQQSFCYTLEN